MTNIIDNFRDLKQALERNTQRTTRRAAAKSTQQQQPLPALHRPRLQPVCMSVLPRPPHRLLANRAGPMPPMQQKPVAMKDYAFTPKELAGRAGLVGKTCA